jgi:hypothetical protein
MLQDKGEMRFISDTLYGAEIEDVAVLVERGARPDEVLHTRAVSMHSRINPIYLV